MDTLKKFGLMEKIVHELEDLRNSQQAIMQKLGKIEVDNIELGDKRLEKVLPPFTVRAAHSAADAGRVQLQDGAFTPVTPHLQQPDATEWKVYRGLYVFVRADGSTQILNLAGAGAIVNV